MSQPENVAEDDKPMGLRRIRRLTRCVRNVAWPLPYPEFMKTQRAATKTALAVFAILSGATIAHAQERCTASTQPGDRIATEICDTCPHDGPDATFRFLDRAADAARIPLKNRKLGALAEKAIADAASKGYDVGTK